MQPVLTVEGVIAPLYRDNIDTDAIIPSREMKRVSKAGLGEGLFAGWRYAAADSRAPNPAFVLNTEPWQNARILLAGRNFGCGSSREHAVWALIDYGIGAVIAESFGSIFFGNALRNGLVPVALKADAIATLLDTVESTPGVTATIDVTALTLTCGELSLAFSLPPDARDDLIAGRDPVTANLRFETAIDAARARREADRKWSILE